MQPGIIYRLEFINSELITVRIDISPLDIQIPDADTPQIIPLRGGDTPLLISVINNGEDKFMPIRSKQALIKFRSETGLDISTFSAGADNNWKVDIFQTDTAETIFTGFLVLADNQMPFQPNPQYVVLTASDHLGTIKELPLLDSSGNNPMGKYRVAELIAMCLNRTGLALDIKVVNNLRIGSGQYTGTTTFSGSTMAVTTTTLIPWWYPGQRFVVSGTASNNGTYHVVSTSFSGTVTTVTVQETFVGEVGISATFVDDLSGSHWYNVGLIDAKTFEEEIGTCINCYDVLSRIFGEDCFITQWKGDWYIFRIDEMEDNPVYIANFTSAGAYVSTDAGTTIQKFIGRVELDKFANADTLLRFIRPHGALKETFDFETPIETPCNIDFSRGTLRSTVSVNEKTYFPECWVPMLFTTINPPSDNVFVRKTYINGVEDSRYVVFEQSVTADNALLSEPIWVNAKDRFDMTFQRKLSSDIGGSGFYRQSIAQIRLYGNDGTYWIFKGPVSTTPVGVWMASNSTFTANQNYIVVEGDLQDDLTQLVSNFGDSVIPDMPVGGYLRIMLIQGSHGSTGEDILMPPPTVTYMPYINGTYEKFTGQSNEIVRPTTGYFARRDNKVYVSDSPAPSLKGTIFFISRYAQIYSASAQFIAAGDTIQLSGFHLDRFYAGINIQVTGTASNNITAKVTSASYSLIGNVTILAVDVALTNETVSSVISEALYYITQNWYAGAPIALALPTDPAYLHPYAYIQAYSVWNQFRGYDNADGRGMGINIFSGSVKGLSSLWPDLIYRYRLVDANAMTNDRYFMLISMSEDWKSCMWTATFVEVHNFQIMKIYSDTLTFSYLTE